MPVDRLRPRYSLRSLTCLPRYRAQQPRTATTRSSTSSGTPGCAPAWRGRSPIPGAGTGTGGSRPRSGRVSRIMREDGLVARVPGRRRYSSYEGEVTPAPDNLVDRDFTAPAPNVKWLTDITRDQGQRRKGLPFPDDRLPGRHGRGARGRDVAERGTGATRCRVRAAATLRAGERPVVSRRPRLSLPVAGMAGTDGPVRPGPVHGREGVQPRQRRGRGVLRPYEGPGPCIPGIGRSVRARRPADSPANTSAGTTIRGSNSRWDGKPGRIQNKPGAGRIRKQLQENVRSPVSRM